MQNFLIWSQERSKEFKGDSFPPRSQHYPYNNIQIIGGGQLIGFTRYVSGSGIMKLYLSKYGRTT